MEFSQVVRPQRKLHLKVEVLIMSWLQKWKANWACLLTVSLWKFHEVSMSDDINFQVMTSQGSSGCPCQHPSLKRFPTRCPRNLRESCIRIHSPQVIHEFSWWTCQRTSIYNATACSSKLIQCAAEFHQKKNCVDEAIASTAHLTPLDAWGVGRKYLHSVPKTCTQSPQFPLNFRLDGRPPSAGKVAIIYNKHTDTETVMQNAFDA